MKTIEERRREAEEGGWHFPEDYQSPRVPPKEGSVSEFINWLARSMSLTVDGKPKELGS